MSEEPVCRIRVPRRGDGHLDLTESQCRALRPGASIGSGTMATAYERVGDDSHVVKFTRDIFDAQAAQEILGEGGSIPGAVKVLDVAILAQTIPRRGIPDVHVKDIDPLAVVDPLRTPVYAITTERVTPLAPDDHEYLNQSTNQAIDAAFAAQPYLGPDWTIPDGVRKSIPEFCESNPYKQRIAQQEWNGTWDAVKCARVGEEGLAVVEKLAQKRIALTDAHGGNFGRRKGKVAGGRRQPGELVALDFGLSGVRGNTIRAIAGLGSLKVGANMSEKKIPTWVWLAGGAAVVAFFLLSGNASAATPGAFVGPPLPSNLVGPPVPVGPVANQPTPPPTQPTFTDGATGVVIAGPSTAIAGGAQHTIASGESWSNIASRAYGNFQWWPFLWDSNRSGSQFTDPNVLNVGDTITIPATVPADPAYQAAIFARAQADRAWWLNGGPSSGVPYPLQVTTVTPMTIATPPAADPGAVSSVDPSSSQNQSMSGLARAGRYGGAPNYIPYWRG